MSDVRTYIVCQISNKCGHLKRIYTYGILDAELIQSREEAIYKGMCTYVGHAKEA